MCRAEAPHLSSLQKKHGDDLIILGINCDNDSAERIRSFVDSEELSYRMLMRGDGVAMRDYHCRTFPALYWIDSEGRVAARDQGFRKAEVLEARARALLGR